MTQTLERTMIENQWFKITNVQPNNVKLFSKDVADYAMYGNDVLYSYFCKKRIELCYDVWFNEGQDIINDLRDLYSGKINSLFKSEKVIYQYAY
jgi:hypothetical protein